MLNVQLDVSRSILATEIGPPTVFQGRNSLKYEPNTGVRSGASIGYRNIGLGFSSQGSAEDVENRVSSKAQDYSLRLLGKNSFDLSYQSANGFYLLDSSGEFNSGYCRKPDMKMERTAFQWIHNFNSKDISLPAMFNYSGWQKDSNWGFLFFANANQVNTSDPSTFIPPSLTTSFTEFANVTEVNRTSYGTGVGLSGALVCGGFQLAALLTVGTAYNSVNYSFLNASNEKINGNSTTANIFLNAGYNGSRNQFGFSVFTSSNTIQRNIEKFEQSRSDFRFFYGYRFSDVNLGGAINGISSWLD